MAPDRHLIRKASLEVNAGSVDAFRFQQDTVAWAQERLLPSLEAIFAGLPPVAEHIVLDRLEISLDAGDAGDWAAIALPRLKAELAAILSRKLREAGAGKGEERLAPGLGFIRKLVFYLERGVLPWNLPAAGPAELARQAEIWLDSGADRDAARELAVAWKLPSARRRFLDAFPSSLILRVLARAYGFPENLMRAWSQDAARIWADELPRAIAPEAPASRPVLPPALLEEILLALSHDPRVFGHGMEEEIVFAFLERLAAVSRLKPIRLRTAPVQSEAFIRSLARLLKQGAEKPRPESHEGPAPAPSAPAAAKTGAPARDSAVPEPRDGRGEAEPESEGVYIANAGLILAAPFLSMLFERTGLSEKAALRDPATALALLHYLPTGEEGPAEFQVPLAKALCGVPFDQAIALPPVLPQAMKEEADRLLESMIGHWAVLKDTSVNGLREAFLQRPGKLGRRPQGDWLLQVEQKAYDMLLQQLPWSFRLIRLPWMPKALRTEWVD